MISDDQLIRNLRLRYGDEAVDRYLEERRRLNEALDENRRRVSARWDKTVQEVREDAEEGRRIEEDNQRKRNPQTRPLEMFEDFVTEQVADGFGNFRTRLRRRFRPPGNF